VKILHPVQTALRESFTGRENLSPKLNFVNKDLLRLTVARERARPTRRARQKRRRDMSQDEITERRSRERCLAERRCTRKRT